MLQQHEKPQHVIGITGGIGSGKSSVSSFLAQHYKLPLINLDQLCRVLLQPQQVGWLALRTLLPKTYFTAKGELDRQYFRQQLFRSPDLRTQVDATLHPLARQEMNKQIARFQGSVLVEIPLLFEAGWQEDVDLILVVFAKSKVRIQRIIERDHVSAQEAQDALAAQQSLRKKATAADHVIDNSGPWEQTCTEIEQLINSNAFAINSHPSLCQRATKLEKNHFSSRY
ncbi:dephospho-CoA kinase [Candidatus Electrothrix sp.]|uniref:dephospho-CoA kinase n=1 Tax=Candidatus Electrothrix sp. TaxID=2170559 RepID=UPI00405755A0